MKGWQSICIPDETTFNAYKNGEEVQVSVLCYPDWIDDFQPGNKVEVFLTSNTPRYPHFTGEVVKYNGIVPSFPKGQPEAISITVKKS